METWFAILIILWFIWLPILLYLCWHLIIIVLALLALLFKAIESLLNWVTNKIFK